MLECLEKCRRKIREKWWFLFCLLSERTRTGVDGAENLWCLFLQRIFQAFVFWGHCRLASGMCLHREKFWFLKALLSGSVSYPTRHFIVQKTVLYFQLFNLKFLAKTTAKKKSLYIKFCPISSSFCQFSVHQAAQLSAVGYFFVRRQRFRDTFSFLPLQSPFSLTSVHKWATLECFLALDSAFMAFKTIQEYSAFIKRTF